MSSPKQIYHQAALRRGRNSQPHAHYFVTFCTNRNSPPLTAEPIFIVILDELHRLESDLGISEFSFTLMPDHVHLVFRLGERLTLGKAIARLKSKTTSQLKALPAPLHWQPTYHDHLLRSDSELHPILHYLYLNPYRAKLIAPDQTYPYTHIAPLQWQWLQPLLNQNCPYPEWLQA